MINSNINRVRISDSSIFKSFEHKGKNLDLSLINSSNYIKLSDIESILNEIRMRNFPLTNLILNTLESSRIILTKSDKPGSAIQILPGVNDNGVIDKIFINIGLIAKKEKIVDPNTGDIREATTVKNYEDLYNLLLAGYVGLNYSKVLNNRSVMVDLVESYVDIFAQLVSRSMGNPLDGDKFRFLIKVFFYNGVVNGMELAQSEKYNIDAARLLNSKYPEFFGNEPKSLEMLLEVLESEFNSLSNVTLETLIGEGVKTLGSNGVFMLDNYPYMLGVMVTRMRKDRSGTFSGYILKVLDPYARKMLTEVLRSVI